MNSNFQNHLRGETEKLREAGLFKTERVITSAQSARITATWSARSANLSAVWPSPS